MVVSYLLAREKMVEEQLMSRGIRDSRVLAAMAKVRRHLFVAEELRSRAYDDNPLPIGEDQTISQPYMVALMVEALGLKGKEQVLEIGTGSGYAAAVLAELCAQVFYNGLKRPSRSSQSLLVLARLRLIIPNVGTRRQLLAV